MKYKITIPKKGKNAGVASVEGLQENNNCMATLQDVAVSLGSIESVQPKDHFDDDNDAPLFDNVGLK